MNLKWNDEMLLAFKKIMEIDKRFENLLSQIGPPENRAVKEGFQSLAKIIIGQQISTIVAKKIYDKLIKDNMLNEQNFCLLYTSDAADDMQCVDLGGRRIIKKSRTTPGR